MSKPIIEALFGSGAKSKVITWLYLRGSDEGAIAARALAREAGVPYGSIDKTLRELVQDQLVTREEDANGPRYRAPYEDARLAGLFILIRQDSIIVEQLKRVFRSAKQVEYAGIFGSFASGKTRMGSDIDVLVLEGADVDRFQLMSALAKVAERLQVLIHPQFYSTEEFRSKLETGDPVVLGILANPRIDLRGALPWQN